MLEFLKSKSLPPVEIKYIVIIDTHKNIRLAWLCRTCALWYVSEQTSVLSFYGR